MEQGPARQVTLLLPVDRRGNSILPISMPSATRLGFVTVGSSAMLLQRALLCKSWGSVAKAAHSRRKMTKCIFSKEHKKRKGICLHGLQKSDNESHRANCDLQVEITAEYFPLEWLHQNIVFFNMRSESCDIIVHANEVKACFGKGLLGSPSNRIRAWRWR